MRQLTELDIYILKQEFPQLSLTEDPDIERYFEFRSLNRQAEALRLYNTKLVHRYPDNKIRVQLMTYYRKHDYRFHILLTDSLVQLADRTVVQVKRVIVFFADTIAPLKRAEVYTIIKVCEKVINAISPNRFAAISFTEKYTRYAEKLKYHAADMRQAADIIRMYITDTISSVREYREEQDRKNAQEQTRRALQKAKASVVDFSKIVFTKEQIAAITIPSSIIRIEDKVLAYTMKYWNRYADGAFENILLLYSRKYGTNHYAIFHAVKVGRVRNWKDEELLHAVLANVAQGYYYSISGDLYLQRAWKQLKLNLGPSSPPSQAKGLPVPAVKKAKAAKRSKKQTEKTAVQKTNKAEKETASTRKKKETKKNVQVNSVSVSGAAMPSAKKVLQKNTVAASESRNSTKPVAAASILESGKIAQEQAVGEKASSSVQIYPINEPKGLPVSIAETVKKVTGKSYGIYRDLFFKEVRSAIRTILQHSVVQKLSFFGSEQNNAENIIYRFLETNYDNPYQQWQGSKEQADVFTQGFRIESLEPIIRLWAKENL
ncbi:hypothetical protein DWB79_06265 [Treponema medium]|uniref:Uncharacterized protein n=2 Tax=Treponema medium TaxID=58231 RepID=A0AA87NR32_TREMD|nr:hypothetical protein [Treponema medium]EPF28994.1 hypothetical protein HMPREF9195_01237 [Treponema medium ATCC 700293]QSH97356.1 hypothetical protein DWB79_06265 [Treponema medium]